MRQDSSDNWTTAGDWSAGVPTSSSNVVISEGNPQITGAVGTIATLNDSSNLTFVGGSLTVSGAFTNSGSVNVDAGGGQGGSALTIGGTLTNSGNFSVGNGALGTASTVNVASINNFIGTTLGSINVSGDTGTPNTSARTATFSVASAAGFGTTGSLVGSVNLYGNAYGHAVLSFASGQITTIAGNSQLSLNGPDAFLADASNTTSNSALTGLATVTGLLNLNDGAVVSTVNAMSVGGQIDVDAYGGQGGASLAIGGALTNTGSIYLGNGVLGAASAITAASVTNYVGTTFGAINVTGDTGRSDTTPVSATFEIASAAGFGATGVLIGSVNLSGNAFGHALLEFASGEITTIAGSSELTLSGPDAFLADANNTTSDSAVTSLATVTGQLNLNGGAQLMTVNALTLTGTIFIDAYGGQGGSSLAIGGAVTNTGSIDLGNGNLSLASSFTAASVTNFVGSSLGTINVGGDTNTADTTAVTATFDITGAAGFGAAGSLIGSVNLYGNAYGHAVLEFASGEITKILAQSELTLSGPDAFLADASNITSNSALTALATITGQLNLNDGAVVTTSNALGLTGALFVDAYGGQGGASLNVGGGLTNSGTIDLGNGNLSAAARITATSLTNYVGSTLGAIAISGNTNTSVPLPVSATLDITSAAGFGTASTLTGNVSIYGNANGHGLLEFASGEITTIAAKGQLTLSGPDAFVADAANTNSNSALTGLATIAGLLNLNGGAQLTTSGALGMSGTLYVDAFNVQGGSSLTVGGALINSGTIDLGNGYLSSVSSITATSLTNYVGTTFGSISIEGDQNATAVLPITATMDITGAAGFGTASTLAGSVSISGNADGTGLLEFGSGEIATIATSGSLTLSGPDAFLADASNNASNSALTSLATVAGLLNLNNGAELTTGNALTVSNTLYVDAYGGQGGASLTVGGELTNNKGTIDIGNSNLSSISTLSATSLSNSGTININGSSSYTAELADSGAGINTGTINIGGGGLFAIAGALTGSGNIALSYGGSLILGGSSSGGTITFGTGGGSVQVTSSPILGTAVADFSAGDTLDFSSVGYAAGDYVTYTENSSESGGIVTVDTQSGAEVAAFAVAGNYNATYFSLGADGSNHLLVGSAAGYSYAQSEDFNADGDSDILLDNRASGSIGNWTIHDGAIMAANALGAPAGYTVVGTGAFAGGATSDVLLENKSSGALVDWIMANGVIASVNYVNTVPTGWKVVGTGDFLGNGTSDVLLQNAGSGQIVDWEMQGGLQSGSMLIGGAPGFNIVATGNFNGGTTTDILLQNATTGALADWILNGGVVTSINTLGAPTAGYKLVGTGDFNGDGVTDLLFQNTSTGTLMDWTLQNGTVSGTQVIGTPAGYSVVGTGDYNDDGTSDILLQNSSGSVVDWTIKNSVVTGSALVNSGVPEGLIWDGSFTLPGTGALNDFNGDGTSDILLQNSGTGAVADWIVQNGTVTAGNSLGTPAGYTVVGTGDFTGGATSDILLENTSNGALADWVLTNGVVTGVNAVGTVPTGWSVAGTGDFTGNGISDVLLDNAASGQVVDWTMQNGVRSGSSLVGAAAGYTVVATGDFNGDGTTDILLQNSTSRALVDWIMSNGAISSSNYVGTPGAGYQVVGTGDFTGNGTSDVLFQNSSTGALVDWTMQNGVTTGAALLGTPAGYSVTGTGDYNGDGTSDILLQNSSGALVDWTIKNNAVSASSLVSNGVAGYKTY